MTYNTVDTIPAKLYFKILANGHVNLLTDLEVVETIDEGAENVITKKELDTIWINIQNEDAELQQDPKNDKVVSISTNIEKLLARLESIHLSVFYLKVMPDDEDILNHLKTYGYKFTDDIKADLERIERETEGILLKVKNYNRQLEKLKPKKNNGKSVPFDETVLGYGVVTGLTYRTNQITLSEYRALINVGNQKMKAIEKSIGNGKR